MNSAPEVCDYSPFGDADPLSILDEAPLPAEYSDDALSRVFTARHAETLRYTAEWSRWNRYDGRRWSRDNTLGVFDLARSTCREVARFCEDKRIAQRICSAQTVAAVEKLARADRAHAATPEQWDADPWLLNTPGGVVDLTTGDTRPASPEDHCTKMTAVSPEGECPQWHVFLDRVTGGDSEYQAYIQRLCGYALTGLTREQSLAFLYGAGANGKSTFLTTLSGLMADYATSAPMDLFTDTKFTGHPTEVASLQGARLVTAVETEEGRRWNESRLKLLTGGDRVTARFMRGDFFTFAPTFKLLIAGNHRPALRTVDEAMRRRFHMLPFTANIPSAERDPQLIEKLQMEWPGILRWAIDGCVSWNRVGLQPPATVREASVEYLESEDTLQQWMDECCEFRKDAWSASAVLFTNWQRYAEAAGEPAGTQKRFAQRVAAHGLQAQRTAFARGFAGVRLRCAEC